VIVVSNRKQLEIQRALLAAFRTRDAMVELLQTIDRRFAEFEGTSSDFKGNVARVVDTAVADRWILELLRSASEEVSADPDLHRLVAELEPIVPLPGIDHFQVCQLSGSFLMLDRAELRTTLQGLNTPQGKRILVVRGPAKAGKTHTAQFISYLSDALGDFSFVLIDLAAFTRLLGPGVPVEPHPIAEQLAGRLQYELHIDDPPANGPWAHWILDFCERFQTKAMYDPLSRWIVIDAFNAVVATQNTLDLVKELAIRVSRALPRFRLILLGFGTDLPPDVSGHLETELIAPLQTPEITEFFSRVYTQHKIAFDEDMLVDSAVRVLKGLDPKREDFFVELVPRMTAELTRAAQGNGHA
jgi:hypothetical protein